MHALLPSHAASCTPSNIEMCSSRNKRLSAGGPMGAMAAMHTGYGLPPVAMARRESKPANNHCRKCEEGTSIRFLVWDTCRHSGSPRWSRTCVQHAAAVHEARARGVIATHAVWACHAA